MEEDEDEELRLALAMSQQESAGGDSNAAMSGLLQDMSFLSDVLSSLPGVDTSDPRQGVLDGMKEESGREKRGREEVELEGSIQAREVVLTTMAKYRALATTRVDFVK